MNAPALIPAPAPVDRSRTAPGRVTGRLRVAIEAMVWQGLQRKEAAAFAAMAEHSLYQALRRPPVKAYYLAECEVLRTSGRARRIHRLEAIQEQDRNQQASVNAIRALELMGDELGAINGNAPMRPGIVIVVHQASPLIGHQAAIEAKPLIEHEVVRDDE